MPELKNVNNKDTAEGKSLRTFVQTAIATAGAFFYGLWNLPGVSEYTTNFIQTEGFSLLIALITLIGVPAGVISYLMNRNK